MEGRMTDQKKGSGPRRYILDTSADPWQCSCRAQDSRSPFDCVDIHGQEAEPVEGAVVFWQCSGCGTYYTPDGVRVPANRIQGARNVARIEGEPWSASKLIGRARTTAVAAYLGEPGADAEVARTLALTALAVLAESIDDRLRDIFNAVDALHPDAGL